ncbi:transporter substrate-binding domain-containing protein [Pseudoalteromonas sp. OOF1S-7]|uniref:substrate-binding periplasmic protein n=1 Tax=Pseudoalteromonas sp. OOF1S-7 TaxID=2917757 RepID=UPI001EF54A98|nr:transporter substrate-binding domain-containing protein [Pseudoalteromonas sp. OOF1S-7]MCG7534308.1 transporter substrate-binding domain-containing protein [Pseudoalteromonas sp. OOF1S-7]
MRFAFLFVFFVALIPFSGHTTVIRFVAEDLPPYHYLDKHGKPAGALVEIAQQLLKQTRLQGHIEIMPMARALHEMQARDNTLLLSWLKTPERAKKYRFLGVMCHAQAYLIGLKERTFSLQDLESARQHRVSTIRGYYSERFLRAAGFSEDHELVLVSHYQTLWHMLFKGRTDLVLTNAQTINKELNALGLPAEQVERKMVVPAFPSELHLATNLDFNQQQADLLMNALAHLKESGKYQQILAQWQLN